jgi:dUTP pyrophosphatase
MQIKVKLGPGAVMPARGSEQASGLDLYAVVNREGFESHSASFDWVTIRPGDNLIVPTGVFLELPVGFEAQVRPRSGLAKDGIVTAFGTIDSDYRGEIKVNLFNHSWKHFSVKNGMRIAQLVIQPVVMAELVASAELSATVRGESGMGSTGV